MSALCWGLSEFKGTVILASHDRDLITEVATKIIYIDHKGYHIFDGSYEDYLASRS